MREQDRARRLVRCSVQTQRGFCEAYRRLELYEDVQVTCLITSLKAFTWLYRIFLSCITHFSCSFCCRIWKTPAVICVVCHIACFSALFLSVCLFSFHILCYSSRLVFYRCLIKDFETRPSVTHLLEHPFIKQAHGKDTSLRQQLSVLIREQQDVGSRTKTRYILLTTQTAGVNWPLSSFLKWDRYVHELQ